MRCRSTRSWERRIESHSQIKVGERAPDFSLPDNDGKEWSLASKRGSVVLLLFYPGNETLVCTKQLCSLRDNWARFAGTNTEIAGVSVSGIKENKEFAAKYKLPMTILADPTRGHPNLRGSLDLSAEVYARPYGCGCRRDSSNASDDAPRIQAERSRRSCTPARSSIRPR